MLPRSAVLVACTGIALGCGARSTVTAPAATSSPPATSAAAACRDLAHHVASVVEAAAPADRRPGPPYLRERIAILEVERERFRDRSPRVRAMWLGYCEAEAARRRRQSLACFAPGAR